MDALSWQPERGSRLIVLDRASGELLFTLEIARRYCLHLINSFEEHGQLVVDVVELERPVYDQYQVVARSFRKRAARRSAALPHRPRHPPADGRRETDRLRSAPDFPAIHPHFLQRSYDDLWLLGMSQAGEPGRKFFDQLVHLRWSRPEDADTLAGAGRLLPGRRAGFPARPGQPKTRLRHLPDLRCASSGRVPSLVFDALAVAHGPLARLPLRHPASGLLPCLLPSRRRAGRLLNSSGLGRGRGPRIASAGASLLDCLAAPPAARVGGDVALLDQPGRRNGRSRRGRGRPRGRRESREPPGATA